MEQIVWILPGAYKPKSFGRRDCFTIVVTDQRTIFAMLTSQMLKDAAAEAQQKGKEEGKGFFARWGDQMQSGAKYHERYSDMEPDDILGQTPQNFSIDHSSLVKLKAKKKVEHDEDSFEVKTELQYESGSEKYKFMLDDYSKQLIENLVKVYGSKLQT